MEEDIYLTVIVQCRNDDYGGPVCIYESILQRHFRPGLDSPGRQHAPSLEPNVGNNCDNAPLSSSAS